MERVWRAEPVAASGAAAVQAAATVWPASLPARVAAVRPARSCRSPALRLVLGSGLGDGVMDGQQAGNEPDQVPGHVEHDTMGDHAEPLLGSGCSLARLLLPGAPRLPGDLRVCPCVCLDVLLRNVCRTRPCWENLVETVERRLHEKDHRYWRCHRGSSNNNRRVR